MIGNSQTWFTLCIQHNLPNDVFIDKSQQVCRQCAFEFHETVPVSAVKDSNYSLIERFESQANSNLIQMNLAISEILYIKNIINKQIKNLINEIQTQIQIQDDLVKQSKDNISQKELIQQLHQKYLLSHKNFQRTSIQQIQIIIQNYAFDQVIQLLQEMDLSILSHQIKVRIADIEQPIIQTQQNQQNIIQCEYQLLSESTILHEICYAIAFNKDASLVAVGQANNIKVFEFENEQLEEIQELQGHSDSVFCLQFMKLSNQFISGSWDNLIKIWQQKNTQWINTEILIGHSGFINCLIINENENLIISGGYDELIIVWRLKNQKWIIDQYIKCSDRVISLSLNTLNTKLISSLNDNQISIFEYHTEKWNLVQKIDVNPGGLRLCFISESEFVFLPHPSKCMHLYNFNFINKQFEKMNELEIKGYSYSQDLGGFPMQFIASENLLIVKNSIYLNILRKNENNVFVLEQTIRFQHHLIHGSVSDDGLYLLIWNYSSDQLQVRKLMMML